MSARFEHGYALLIGAGQVPKWAEMSLPESVQDVRAIKKVLVDPGLCAYPDTEEHIRLIHDEDATRTGILESFKWLMQQVDQDPQGTAVLYYSGHCVRDSNSSGYFLVSHEAEESNIASTALAFQECATETARIAAERRLVVLDCCHAGAVRGTKGANRKGSTPRMRTTSPPKDLLDRLGQGRGHAVFCSCMKDESSWVSKGKNISIFTFHFLEGLRGRGQQGRRDRGECLPVDEPCRPGGPKKRQRSMGEKQTPFFLFETQDYAVALLRGGKGLPSAGEFLRGIASTLDPGPEFGDYPELAQDYLSPWSVFERVRLDRFKGREWLLQRLDQFLNDNDRGVLLVEAEAGLGKTAFLAHLNRASEVTFTTSWSWPGVRMVWNPEFATWRPS